MSAQMKYSITKKLSYSRVCVPGLAIHPVNDSLLALRPDVGHPAGQSVKDDVIEAGTVVHGDPEQVVVGIGQCWGEVHLRFMVVGEAVAGVPMTL